MNFYVQVAPAVSSGVSPALQTNALSVLHARRNSDLEGLHSIVSRSGSRTKPDCLCTSINRLVKPDAQLRVQIIILIGRISHAGPLRSVSSKAGRPAKTRTSGSMPETTSEQIAENIFRVASLKMIGVILCAVRISSTVEPPELTEKVRRILRVSARVTSTLLPCLLRLRVFFRIHPFRKGSHAVGVIYFLFLRIVQYGIRLVNLLEHFFRLRIPLIHIRMVFFREFPVCPFNLLLSRPPGQAEHLIIISLHGSHLLSVRTFPPVLPAVLPE